MGLQISVLVPVSNINRTRHFLTFLIADTVFVYLLEQSSAQDTMGLCKCPKRDVTNQFCYEHRVNVCENCMVKSHPKVREIVLWFSIPKADLQNELISNPVHSYSVSSSRTFNGSRTATTTRPVRYVGTCWRATSAPG